MQQCELTTKYNNICKYTYIYIYYCLTMITFEQINTNNDVKTLILQAKQISITC